MKQKAQYHEAARAFHRELGLQLFLCRCEKKLSLSQVAWSKGVRSMNWKCWKLDGGHVNDYGKF